MPTLVSPRSTTTLYFPPGGHTHDRHTIPPDRLHISLSDPVLVAAEERLCTTPDRTILNGSGASNTTNHRSIAFHLQGRILSRGCDDGIQVTGPLKMTTQGTTTAYSSKAGVRAVAVQRPSPFDDSSDICEVMSIMNVIDVSHSRDLPPLASETFKEELYVRGYLKRPASRPVNIAPRKPRTTSRFMSGKILPKVLGRRQGRKVAESLRTEQVAARPHDGPDIHLSEKRLSTIASVTLRVSRVDDPRLESPGMDTTMSTSESFDLHEFSYITAFTTPPSSPSTILDVETFKKGASQGDGKHEG